MMRPESAFAVHLSFNGNCRQAFDYYRTCFGGKLSIQTLADTPHGNEMDEHMRTAVIWATLENQYFRLTGTDLTEDGSIVPGNNVSILIECPSFTERTRLINKLINRNICAADYSDPLINIVDNYRICWILSVQS